jgi:predicted Rossmann-fold nucleotide-binding protein
MRPKISERCEQCHKRNNEALVYTGGSGGWMGVVGGGGHITDGQTDFLCNYIIRL